MAFSKPTANTSDIITTHNHPLIKQVMRLHTTKQRNKQKQFIAEGIRTVSTLIQAGHTPLYVFATNKNQLSMARLSLCFRVPKKDTASSCYTIVSSSVMEQMSTTATPSGILAVFAIPDQQASPLGTGIVLASLSDPGNAGTLIRTAAAMGKKTVVFIESVDPWNPKVVQASAGTIGMMDIFVMGFDELIQLKKDIKLCALVVNNGEKPQASILHNALIMIGSEAHGIPESWLARCDFSITLPMPGGSESLNAAVAGSIALYLATQ